MLIIKRSCYFPISLGQMIVVYNQLENQIEAVYVKHFVKFLVPLQRVSFKTHTSMYFLLKFSKLLIPRIKTF